MTVQTPLLVPRLEEMVALYRECMGLFRDGESLLEAAYQLKRLALNAEIFSVKAGIKGLVFQSLSKETNRLAQDIAERIYGLLSHVQNISAKSIESANTARLCEKYQEAIDRKTMGATLKRVDTRRETIGRHLVEDLELICSDLKHSHHIMCDMERLHLQLPVIATLMKIEASRDARFSATFSTNADNLLALNLTLKEAIEQVQGKTRATLSQMAQMTLGGNL